MILFVPPLVPSRYLVAVNIAMKISCVPPLRYLLSEEEIKGWPQGGAAIFQRYECERELGMFTFSVVTMFCYLPKVRCSQ